MKQNQVCRHLWLHKGQARPNKIGLKMIIAVFLAFFILCSPALSAKETVSGGPKAQGKRGEIKLKSTSVTPQEESSIKKVSPVKLEHAQVKPSSLTKDKAKLIQWHLINSGATCGNGSITCRQGTQDGSALCGTVGQLAVGSGSSPSYGLNSGFWQEVLQGGYLRGDANGDGMINIADVVYLLNYLFTSGSAPDPLWVGDANCDDLVNIADVVYLINYLFGGGPPPQC